MTDQPLPNIIQLMDAFYAALARKDAYTLQRLTEAYYGVYDNLRGKIDALVLKLEQTGALSQGEIQRLAQYGQLLDAVEKEVNTYGGYLKTEVSTTARTAIADANRDARIILAETLGQEPRLVAMIQAVSPRVTQNLLAFLSPEGELFRRLSGYGEEAAKRIAQSIIEHVTLGRNPRVLATDLVRDKLGMTLTDALRTARTVQLYSYREATRANYVANNRVVKGWIWYAHLDSLTCASCISKHGTFHNLDESLSDHHNGRCAMVPVTITNPNPDIQTGEAWFNSLPEGKQRAILGSGKYDAWKEGKFDFADLSKNVADDVYGNMWTETPLKELVP